MKSKAFIIFLKEFRDALRDKRALSMLALFIFMYPALSGWIVNMQIKEATRPKNEAISLTVIGAAQAPTLMGLLKQRNVTITEHAPMAEPDITSHLADKKNAAVLRVSDKFVENYEAMRPASVELWFDSAGDNNGKRREVEDALREYSSSIASARLLAHGVSPVLTMPVKVQRYDVATNASRSAILVGALMAMFFFPAFMFCMSTAVDITAGERERRSLEVLIAQPATTTDIVVGKWLAAASLSMIGLSLELLLAHFILKWLALEEIGMSWRLTEWELLGAIITSLPLCLLAAALEIALAMNAKSFKEAQTTVSFVLLIPMIPAFVIPMLKLETGNWMYAVPMLSNQTLLKELSKGGGVGFTPYALTFGVTLAAALVCVAFSAWRMKSEKYILSV